MDGCFDEIATAPAAPPPRNDYLCARAAQFTAAVIASSLSYLVIASSLSYLVIASLPQAGAAISSKFPILTPQQTTGYYSDKIASSLSLLAMTR